ncbi:carbohydrate ABC transporter permease [Jonesiaceae bacterium BS-20]|uniref:Carbohydrate ABC transporter permease n=1 Tax=Jonesiaceae bacterium BS-20 TaxID=3120821 RepID=A0AAU7DTN1_9MICO
MNKTNYWGVSSKVAFLGFWLLVTLFPLYWILVTSLKPAKDIYSYPLQYWPEVFSLENYKSLLVQADFGKYIGNSLLVALIAGGAGTAIAILSAYVLSRFEFRSKGAVLIAFLITQMIPTFIALGPLYQMMVKLNLVDQKFGLMLVYVAMCIPFSTVMLRGFFSNIPASLDEAAMIDGCSRLGSLWRIILPVMKPGIIAAFIFNFVNCWNELFLSVTLMNSDANKTVPTALNGFITSYNIDWSSMSAAAVLTVIPSMILFAFASKHIVMGLTAGAVKE